MREHDSITSDFYSSVIISIWSIVSNRLFIFLILFFFHIKVFAQDASAIIPEYEWVDSENLTNVTVSLFPFSANTEDITISIDTDSQGYVYTLSFGAGIAKRNPDGSIIDEDFIPAGALDNPLDLAIDEAGFIYVADYLDTGDFFDNGKIKVFDSQGNLLPERQILTSFYRPLGVAVDEERVYVTEYNAPGSGTESDEMSRVRIFNKYTGVVVKSTDLVEVPYRIAVNSLGKIYVSQAGNNDPAVLIFNSNLTLEGELQNIISPGSVVVDEFDYLHVIEYNNIVDFEEFLNFEDLRALDLLRIAAEIDEGVENEDFIIKVFNSSGEYSGFVLNEIDFPLDLAFSQCKGMYVNNLDVLMQSFTLDVDLEIYERTPSFDNQDPLAICIADGMEFSIANGPVTITADDIDNGSTDNCGIASMDVSPKTFSTAGVHQITLTVTDTSGNINSCTTTIYVIGPEAKLEITCPGTQTGEVNGNCEFEIPDYTSLVTSNGTLTQSPAAGSKVSAETTIVMTASLDGETETCEFQLKLNDNIDPVIECSTDITGVYDSSKGYELQDYTGNLSISDNCDAPLTITQDPPEGTLIFEDESEIVFTATDAFGNSATCTVRLSLTDTPETLRFTSCPGNQAEALDAHCEFILPDYTLEAETNHPEAVITQNPPAGEVVQGKATIEVILTATLGSETMTCRVPLSLGDLIPPDIVCPEDQTESYDPAVGFVIPDYSTLAQSADNCGEITVTQDPVPGTIVFGNTPIQLHFRDTATNLTSCFFQLKLEEVSQPRFECPLKEDLPVVELNDECKVEARDYVDLISSFEGFANEPQIVQTEFQDGTGLHVRLEVYDGEGGVFVGECNFIIPLEDTTPPQIDCPNNPINISPNENGVYILPDFSNRATDSCDSNLDVIQDPPAGEISASGIVTLTATDDSGNTSQICSFDVVLLEEQTPIFTCPDSAILLPLELNSECKVEVPNFNISDPQNFSVGPFIVQTEVQDGNTLNVSLEVYDGEGGQFVGECNFEIPLVDATPPQIDCPNNPINISPDENGIYILPDFSNRATDSCDSHLDIIQDPPPGEITQSGNVSLSATDDSGNTSEICSFEVILLQEGAPSFDCPSAEALPILELDENCMYETPDFNSLFSNFQNFEDPPVFVQNTEQLGTVLRVVIRVYDGEEKAELLVGTCEFHVTLIENYPPEASCHSAITIKLGPDGTRTIVPEDLDNGSTDNCGGAFMSLSRDTFTTADLEDSPIEVELTLSDTFGNTDTCTVAVTVEPYEPEEPQPIVCISSLSLPLDENGEAHIDVNQLYEGDLGPGGTVSVDKVLFTCEDLGQNTIFLDYTGNSSGGCSIIVNVVDEIAPVPMVSNLEIDLGENGTASISAEDIDNGSTDNCTQSGLQYSLSQTIFNCSDRGFNNVEFTVTDASGNSATTIAIVTVNDPEENCLVTPEPPGERDFVKIFPNPSRGLVQIVASPNIEIQRVEVFDMRGRYMGTFDMTLNPGTHSYSLNLQHYQTGVYTLRIIADVGEYIRRAIISTF